MRNTLVLFVIAVIVLRSIHAEDGKLYKGTSEGDDHHSNYEHEPKDEDNIKVHLRTDDIRKSPRDERSYRGLILTNGLRVVLISDPKTDRAAAALTVNVGSMHDPEDTPGLAHFLEHMLFMGSEKYPDENYYDVYLKNHAGQANAETYVDYQIHYFDVTSDHLAEAVDIAAQMFLHPRLTPSAMEREVNAVDSEYQKNLMNDYFIREQLENSLSKPGHGHGRFGDGNKKTLQTEPQSKGIDVNEKLWELFRERFSSNMMQLAVLGKENLHDLEKIVVPLYEKIGNKTLSRSVYLEHPWGPEQLNRELRFVPKNDSHVLKIIFPSPNPWEYYEYAPAGYVRHLFQQEGPGSLMAELREQNWIHYLEAWGSHLPGFGCFNLYMGLTEKGLDYVNDIVKLIFQYLYLLKTDGIQKNIFDEFKQLSELAFRFKDKEDPLNHAYEISTSLKQGISFENVLSHQTPNKWDPSIIKGFLDIFVPENMNILIGSKLFEKEANLAEEQWYGTKYTEQRISEDLINEMWEITQQFHIFHIPPPNEFIPGSFDLYPQETNQSEFPGILHESEMSQFWFKQDNEFKIPKFYIQMNIFNPMSNSKNSIRRYELSLIFVDLFRKMFTSRVDQYMLDLAGLSWEFKTISRGVKVCENLTRTMYRITLSGYTEKLPQFTKIFFAELMNFEVREDKFNICKENWIQAYKNFDTNQPYEQVKVYLQDLLYETTFTVHECLAALETLRVDDMIKYRRQFFNRVFIQGLIYGNCDEKLAKEVVRSIESAFPLKSVVLAREIEPSRVAVIEDGMSFTFEAEHEHSLESGYFGYFQVGPGDLTRNIVLTNLFDRIVSEKCFKTLRTDEQLGYVVGCRSNAHSGVLAFMVWVQSARNPNYVNSRVEVFLRQIKQNLIEMSPEEYEKNRSSLRDTYLKKVLGQKERLQHLWNEIENRRYLFEWKEEYITQLDTLQKEDVVEFFETYIAESSTKRRKIDIHVTSRITNPPVPDNEPIKKSVKMENSSTFPFELAAYPRIVSRRQVVPPGAPVSL